MASESTRESAKATNVQVAVRLRPANGEEKRSNQAMAVSADPSNRTVSVSVGPVGKKQTRSFTFDRVFGMYSTQDEVFEGVVRPVVEDVLAGFNCTIFAYGQTGTGKTHTMEGDLNSEADAGIVPRSVKTVVETLESSGAEFTIRVSFLELYNEELQDLLVPPTSDKKLKLCETDKGVVCTNLEEITVLSKNDIFEIVARGIKQRATAATLCNKNSSRSHSIFTMKIMIRETAVDGEEVVRHGQLNLVDLAGSECVGRSGAKDGRAKEAGSINQSLLTLGRVITALVDHHGHIPYRDSKLTRLLQESLGGRAKTCIIATLSPAQMAVEESLSTLDYAHRAKNIKNAPQVNQKMTKKTVMKEYCAEIETLRAQLQITREKNGVYVDPAEYYAMEQRISAQEAQLVDCESSLRQRSEELKVLRQEKDEVQSHLVETQRTLGSVTSQLQAAQVELETAHARLKSVQIELACTERVVSEQVTTESALQKHGGELQSEVSLRRGERDRLLDKVGRLADQEALRHDTTTKFVAQVSVVCQEELLKGVSEMLASTSTESSQLCSGVLEMLSKGKDTCGSLKAAIDAALVTLIRDAERAKVDMTTSCGELNEHLRGTRDNLTTVLTSLQTSLGAWLGEVDDGMQRASSQLSQQQEQLAALEAHLKRSSENVQQLASDFQANQEARGQQALADARSFEAELSQRLQQHKEELGEQARAAQQGVAFRAKEIEKAMQSLLEGLVSSAGADLSAVSSSAAAFCDDATARVSAHGASVGEAASASTALLASHVIELSKESGAAKAKAEASLSRVEQCRSAATAELGAVGAAVEGKRASLMHTVESVCSEVSDAIVKGCESVDQTSDAANTILAQVKSATEGMTASASSAMDGFKGFLDTKGQDVCSGVQAHFSSVENRLCAQQREVQSVVVQMSSFADAMAVAVVQPTGTTPRKLPEGYTALAELESTRPHKDIKDEARLHLLDGGSVPVPVSAGENEDSAATASLSLPAPVEGCSADAADKLEVTPLPPPPPAAAKENAGPNVATASATTRPSGLAKGALSRSKTASDMRNRTASSSSDK